jgi:chromosome segregation and condensation protein ScpB
VLIEHLGRLTALHLGLYLLRTYKGVVDIEREGKLACEDCRGARQNHDGDGLGCAYDPEVVVDCGEDARSGSARLANASWVAQEEIIARYVRAHLTLRKLWELEDGLGKKPLPKGTLEDIAAIRDKAPRGRLDEKARDRITSLLGDSAADERLQLVETRDQYARLGLSDFETYMALLFQSGERRWFNYLRFLLDSLFLKNEPDGLLRQPLGGRRVRRFTLSAGMLETLALVALIQPTERGPETRPVRLDQLIDRLDKHYGLLVARPPAGLEEDPAAVNAMLENQRMLRKRLRESGLFVDLSDAFLGQMLKPRVEVRA